MIQDQVQPDGSVIRTITTVTTQTFTAKQYQDMQVQLQNKIADLTSQLATVQTNVEQAKTNATKVDIQPSPAIELKPL